MTMLRSIITHHQRHIQHTTTPVLKISTRLESIFLTRRLDLAAGDQDRAHQLGRGAPSLILVR